MGKKSERKVRKPKCLYCDFTTDSWHDLPTFGGKPYCPNCKKDFCGLNGGNYADKLKREDRNGIF